MASSFAGSGFGFMAVPRVGQEVLVQLLDGNPDRLLITGRVPGAGMLNENLGGLMTHLRKIGGLLWACRQHRQVYRRFAKNDGHHVDQGLYVNLDPANFAGKATELLDAMDAAAQLECMDGIAASDVYVVGLQGFMAHFDGKTWRKLELPTDKHLNWVRCYSPDEVWACGHNGTLLKGNARDGLKEMSSVDDNQTWVCLSKFQDKVFLSAEDGLYVLDGKKIAPVKTKLKPELQDAGRVDHADGVLWSIGVKDLVYSAASFDFKNPHPQHANTPTLNRLGDVPTGLEVYEYSAPTASRTPRHGAR